MSQAPTSELAGWTPRAFTAAGFTHDVFEKGDGPGVVLLPEIPGATPEVLGLADHLVDSGFTVALPSLFGEPGRALSPGYLATTVPKLCVSREFQAFALNARRPVADYVRALARELDARTPGPGVGVIGMCFSGGFALAAAADDSVLAAVGSQPSVPFPFGGARRRDPGMSEGELAAVESRDVCLLGLRFSRDKASPPDRFRTLRDRLGDRFEVIELSSAPGNPHGFSGGAHQVITNEVRLDPANAAADARTRVVEFLRQRLVHDAPAEVPAESSAESPAKSSAESSAEVRVVSAGRDVEAAAASVFELIADPAQQPRWDGNDNLADAAAGQRVEGVGAVFTMTLTKGKVRENHVVEFEEGRLIAWRPAEPGKEPPGHLWRWELEPLGPDRTRVTHTYDWTLLTDERRMATARGTTPDKLRASLDRLAALAAGDR